MKRIVPVLLAAILFIIPASDASAWPWTKHRVQKTREVLVDRDSGEAERASEHEEYERKQVGNPPPRETRTEAKPPSKKTGPPVEKKLKKARGKKFDLRTLPSTKPVPRERPEREGPNTEPVMIEEGAKAGFDVGSEMYRGPVAQAAAPAPLITFDGLDRENWGAGSPPDTTGDVGPEYYIQAVNTSVGVYRKSDGFREAAFTFDTLMSQGNFGNLCDTDNFGDPVVLYDTFEDRWILTNFAFVLDGASNVNPPIAFQCFAVSMTGNPLTGGWNFYSIEVDDGLHDYEKLGVWTDGIYMSANMFGYPSGAAFITARAWAINKAQMYAGSPTVQIVQFDIGGGDFTVVPSNARLQTGTPPAGSPNYFLSTWNFLNAVGVYKFHVDWNSIGLSTFTGPDIPIAATSWPNASVANVPQSGTAQLLDSLQIRAMVQNQYTNLAGTESLWIPHTVRRANTTGFAAPRWYQVNVTGGTVAANLPQAATWDPDAANVMHRFMPSLAIDRTGNMALAYSTSSSTTFPSIKYAGRLATDPVNTFSQTEQTLFAGTASQTSSARWGDYSSVALDPDGCTFWITNQYANPVDQAFDKRWLTRIGSFRYPECTVVGAGGMVTGTVTATAGGTPISGATVSLGTRSQTTDASGAYTFTAISAGTYPFITASAAGYVSSTVTNFVVTDDATTAQDFSLAAAPTSGCLTDTSKSDFQTGVGTSVDVTTTPGSITLSDPATIDQQNTTLGNQGAPFNSATWLGQTFTAAITGPVSRVDMNLFSLNCGAVTMPDLTVSIRNAAGNLPTGADLASATMTGFCNGGGGWFTATFATPLTITAGTQYALVVRASAPIPAGTPAPGYFWVVSVGTGATALQNPYAGGRRANSSNSGSTWAGAAGNANNDHGFKVYLDLGYSLSGNQISSTKDSNSALGLTPIWDTMSWNGATPANTTLRFQVAGSNAVNGPFNYVGPDGSAATHFTTSGASLAQFYGLRYLRYKAYLDTTDVAATPVVNDVTICFANTDCSATDATITPSSAQACASSTGNTASGPAGAASYSWSITNGTITSSTTSQSITYTAGASGSVLLSLSIVASDGCHASSSTSVAIVEPPTPVITPGGPTTFCAGGSVTLTSDSESGNQWYLDGNAISGETNQTLAATTSGSYTSVVTVSGCEGAPSNAIAVTVTPLPPTPTITPGGPTTFCIGGSVTLTSSSASGNQWYLDGNPIGGETNQTLITTASGSYTVVVTASGCASLPSSPTVITVNPIPSTPTITPGGPTTFCAGGSVTLTSSVAAGNQWYLDGNVMGGETNQTLVASTGGSYTVVVTISSCPSAPSAPVSVTATPLPATPAITPGGPTKFCAGGSVTLTSDAATGNQWFLNGNPIGGATGQQYVATASGNYTVDVTASGCLSAPSAAVSVIVDPLPTTPSITPGGPTTFCTGGSVTLTSSSATGNQWFLNGNPLGGETSQQLVATSPGDYTVIVTSSASCASAPSPATTVVVNQKPEAPAITPGGPTTFCAGGSVTLTSSVATGNQWYLNGNPIGGASNQQHVASVAGDYTVTQTASGCASDASPATAVVVNPIPAAPSITPGGPTTFCTGGSVTLTSSHASNNQWFLNGNPIGGATSQSYVAAASGSYSVAERGGACDGDMSASTVVTVNLIPTAPTISAGGPTQFCAGGSVTLTSSTATGNQWFLDGNPIGGAVAQQYVATASGNYTVVATQNGCSSSASAAARVTVDPLPTAPSITPGGPTTFCEGGSVTLTSSSAAGNRWFLNGNLIGAATTQSVPVSVSGSYTVTTTANNCTSTPSAAVIVNVNPIPATPTISTGGPTTFCAGGSVTLTSSSASGNQWFLNGNPIGGATGSTLDATVNGNYSVRATATGCSSPASAPVSVTVNPVPPTPTITPNGPTTFCAGGSVTLTSSSAAGNQWLLNGSPIGGATGQSLVVTTAGDYSVAVIALTCSSTSAATTVTVTPNPNATITAPASVVAGSSGHTASVPDAGPGATYAWSVGNGTITAGSGTATITFTAGTAGTLTVGATVTTAGTCSALSSLQFAVTAAPPAVTVTSVTPTAGTSLGNTPVVISGSGFNSGASVTFGGTAATNVIVVNATQITATTPAHAAGAVNVTVTNTNSTSATLTNGYTYTAMRFDPNGDSIVDPSDIFYLVAYLFTGGPSPAGVAGMPSGDANDDGVVDPADIFYAVNYLFGGGPAPAITTPGGVSTSSTREPLAGSLTLGNALRRDGRWLVPVILTLDSGSPVPQSLSLRVELNGPFSDASVRGTSGLERAFEISRSTSDALSYLVSFRDQTQLARGSVVVAEIEVSAPGTVRMDLDRSLTMLVGDDGASKATVANGKLRTSGTIAGRPGNNPQERENQ